MARWLRFAHDAPAFADAVRRTFVGRDGVAIAFLATASRAADPHLAPICPIFADDGLYVSAVLHTPKVRDLRAGSRFALHAFLGRDDEEVQLRGRAHEILDDPTRARVHAAIRFAAFDPTHPIFEFDIESAVWVHWQNPGEVDTRPVRNVWRQRGP